MELPYIKLFIQLESSNKKKRLNWNKKCKTPQKQLVQFVELNSYVE